MGQQLMKNVAHKEERTWEETVKDLQEDRDRWTDFMSDDPHKVKISQKEYNLQPNKCRLYNNKHSSLTLLDLSF
jgi:hypothetical protein